MLQCGVLLGNIGSWCSWRCCLTCNTVSEHSCRESSLPVSSGAQQDWLPYHITRPSVNSDPIDLCPPQLCVSAIGQVPPTWIPGPKVLPYCILNGKSMLLYSSVGPFNVMVGPCMLCAYQTRLKECELFKVVFRTCIIVVHIES